MIQLIPFYQTNIHYELWCHLRYSLGLFSMCMHVSASMRKNRTKRCLVENKIVWFMLSHLWPISYLIVRARFVRACVLFYFIAFYLFDGFVHGIV